MNIHNLEATDAMRKEEKKHPNALIVSPVMDQVATRTLHPKDIYLALHNKYGPDAIPNNISPFPPDFILEFSTIEMRNQILAQEFIEGPWINGLPSFILSVSPWTNDYQSTDESVNQWASDPSIGVNMNDDLDENDPVAFEDPDVVRELFEKQMKKKEGLNRCSFNTPTTTTNLHRPRALQHVVVHLFAAANLSNAKTSNENFVLHAF